MHIYIRSSTWFGFVPVAKSDCTDSFVVTTNLVSFGLLVRRITLAVNIPA